MARRPPHRPTFYSAGLVRRICERIAAGESLSAVCRDADMPAKSTVLRWLLDDRRGAFRRQYALAREVQADVLADELVEIADGPRDKDEAALAKLRIDTRKWVAGKLRPKKYGDKIDLRGQMGITHEDALRLLEMDEAPTAAADRSAPGAHADA